VAVRVRRCKRSEDAPVSAGTGNKAHMRQLSYVVRNPASWLGPGSSRRVWGPGLQETKREVPSDTRPERHSLLARLPVEVHLMGGRDRWRVCPLRSGHLTPGRHSARWRVADGGLAGMCANVSSGAG
jgi:hypothetical protein